MRSYHIYAEWVGLGGMACGVDGIINCDEPPMSPTFLPNLKLGLVNQLQASGQLVRPGSLIVKSMSLLQIGDPPIIVTQPHPIMPS